jgi:hypothetical protein
MNYRILCFHGYNQTSETMKNKMKKVIDKFKGIEFEFAPSINDNMWYELNSNVGIEENLDSIKRFIKDKNYDGFIGFSQGAIFARIFISLYNPPIKFFISLSGLDHTFYSVEKYRFPSNIKFYNIFGKRDIYVTPMESKYLSQYIQNCTEIEFDGKHIIPCQNITNILEEIY